MKYKSLLPILLVTVLGLASCEVDEHVHNWETLNVITPATCVSTGEEIAVCKECGSIEYIITPINPDNHTFSYVSSTAETCETNFYYTMICLDCGYINDIETPNTATGHNYISFYDENEHYEVCTLCGNKRNVQSHNYVLKSTEYQHYYECECGYLMGYENHNFAYESSLINGKHVGTCSFCSYRLEADYHVGISTIDDYSHSGTCAICGEEINGIHQADLREDESGYCYECGTPLNSSGLTYSLNSDGSYSVSAHNGQEELLFIPRSYNSRPVTGIVDKISGMGVFLGRSNLKFVSLPLTMTSIGSGAFRGCENLQYINFSNNLTYIGSYAFYGCSSLPSSLYLPSSLETIGEYAFYNCKSFESVTFEEGIKISSIPSNCFYGCSKLTFIEVPNGVTMLGGSSFRSCTSLVYIIIPESVTNIASYAFNSCNSLIAAYYCGDETSWNQIFIDGTNTTFKNSVPHYFYSEESPTSEGNYWHYDEDGKTPLIWETSEETID